MGNPLPTTSMSKHTCTVTGVYGRTCGKPAIVTLHFIKRGHEYLVAACKDCWDTIELEGHWDITYVGSLRDGYDYSRHDEEAEEEHDHAHDILGFIRE